MCVAVCFGLVLQTKTNPSTSVRRRLSQEVLSAPFPAYIKHTSAASHFYLPPVAKEDMIAVLEACCHHSFALKLNCSQPVTAYFAEGWIGVKCCNKWYRRANCGQWPSLVMNGITLQSLNIAYIPPIQHNQQQYFQQ